jgi:hypothetical protein
MNLPGWASPLLAGSFSLLLLACPAWAGHVHDGPDKAGVLSVQVENDLWGEGSDRHYTHGTRLSYLSSEEVPKWLLRSAAYVPMFSRSGSLRTSYSIGQSIFTPEDIRNRDLIEDDRPYAGWLYCGIGLISDHSVRDGSIQSNRLDSLELNIGLIGPESFAGDTQTAVHDVIGSPRPHGWKHQLRNEPGVMLIYDRQWQAQYLFDVWGLGVDMSPNVGGALGNVMTYLTAGATLRFGKDLPSDYGPPLIRPSLAGSGFFHPQEDFGWYLFAGAAGRLVLYNVFLDGNTFTDRHSVDREPWVGDLQVGLAVTWGDYRLSFTNIFRSDEFKEQSSSTEFGSISLSVRM